MPDEINSTNLESVGKAPAKRKGAAKQMGQTGGDVANQMVGGVEDALTFGKQRRAVSDWVNQKETQLKNAYQKATTALKGPTRYDYSKSKFKVSSPQKARTVAAKTTTARKRTSGKTTRGY